MARTAIAGLCRIEFPMAFDTIDWAAVVSWANLCEDNGWTLFGVAWEGGAGADLMAQRVSNLRDICAAGGGDFVFAAGKLSFTWSAPRVALDTFTDEDLVSDEGEVLAMASYRERVNTVVPQVVLTEQINTKDQQHAADVGIANPHLRRGNKAFTHGVGCVGNYSDLINAAGTLPGYAQLWPGRYSVIAGGAPGFTDDQSDPAGAGSGAGGGDYTLTGGSPARGLVPAGHFLTPPADLAGTARSGAQPAGAYA